MSVSRSSLLDDRRTSTGKDASAGGAAGGAVPSARGAGDTAPGIRSSRSSSSGVMLEASPKEANLIR